MVLFALRAGHELATLAAGEKIRRDCCRCAARSRVCAVRRFRVRPALRPTTVLPYCLRKQLRAARGVSAPVSAVALSAFSASVVESLEITAVSLSVATGALTASACGSSATFFFGGRPRRFFSTTAGAFSAGAESALGSIAAAAGASSPAWREPCHRRLRSLFFFRPRLRGNLSAASSSPESALRRPRAGTALRPPPAGRERGT